MPSDTPTPADVSYPTTERSRVRRLHQRGSHARVDVHAILDAAPLCHVGYVIDGAPYVTPTLHWRNGERLHWHGSAASRFLRQVVGRSVCLTCSLVDGYVLARSAFNHSINYRSAMVFGTAHIVERDDEKMEALRSFTDGLSPGRWDTLRPMTKQELKATRCYGWISRKQPRRCVQRPLAIRRTQAYPYGPACFPCAHRSAPPNPRLSCQAT